MGEYTSNNWFYKPAYGAQGHAEKDDFDAALDAVDEELEDHKSQLENLDTRKLKDVEDTAPSDGDILAWKGSNSRYEPKRVVLPYVVTPEEYGAEGDGSTDDTTAMQDAFDAAAADRKKVVLGANRHYKLTSTINISVDDDKPLVVDGQGAMLEHDSSSDYILDISIDADAVKAPFILDNIELKNPSGDGIYIHSGTSGLASMELPGSIRNIYSGFYNMDGYNITFENTRRYYLQNILGKGDEGDSGIRFIGDGYFCGDILLFGCEFSSDAPVVRIEAKNEGIVAALHFQDCFFYHGGVYATTDNTGRLGEHYYTDCQFDVPRSEDAIRYESSGTESPAASVNIDNIRIQGCFFESHEDGHRTITITHDAEGNAKDIQILNNHIGGLSDTTDYSIYTTGVRDLTISGNQFTRVDDATDGIIYHDGENISEAKLLLLGNSVTERNSATYDYAVTVKNIDTFTAIGNDFHDDTDEYDMSSVDTYVILGPNRTETNTRFYTDSSELYTIRSQGSNIALGHSIIPEDGASSPVRIGEDDAPFERGYFEKLYIDNEEQPKNKVVSSMPSSPDADTLYFVEED